MTHMETARIKEVIGLQIGAIREFAHKLSMNADLEELEAGVIDLEKALGDLKESLEALPHEHRE